MVPVAFSFHRRGDLAVYSKHLPLEPIDRCFISDVMYGRSTIVLSSFRLSDSEMVRNSVGAERLQLEYSNVPVHYTIAVLTVEQSCSSPTDYDPAATGAHSSCSSRTLCYRRGRAHAVPHHWLSSATPRIRYAHRYLRLPGTSSASRECTDLRSSASGSSSC